MDDVISELCYSPGARLWRPDHETVVNGDVVSYLIPHSHYSHRKKEMNSLSLIHSSHIYNQSFIVSVRKSLGISVLREMSILSGDCMLWPCNARPRGLPFSELRK